MSDKQITNADLLDKIDRMEMRIQTLEMGMAAQAKLMNTYFDMLRRSTLQTVRAVEKVQQVQTEEKGTRQFWDEHRRALLQVVSYTSKYLKLDTKTRKKREFSN